MEIEGEDHRALFAHEDQDARVGQAVLHAVGDQLGVETARGGIAREPFVRDDQGMAALLRLAAAAPIALHPVGRKIVESALLHEVQLDVIAVVLQPFEAEIAPGEQGVLEQSGSGLVVSDMDKGSCTRRRHVTLPARMSRRQAGVAQAARTWFVTFRTSA